jgi:enamine deaminase RidA (YjgF/YER057c/UK114 family)
MARKFISSGSPWEAIAGYARAVVDGDWVFVSGTVGYDARTGSFAATTAAQAEQAFDIIERALREAGATLDDAVRVQVHLTDPADLAEVAPVFKRRLGKSRAANTTVCAALVVPEATIEIEVTVLKRPRARTSARARPRKRAPHAAARRRSRGPRG